MAGISITLAGNFGKLDELKDKAHKTAASIKTAFGSSAGKAMFAGLATGATAAAAGITAAIKRALDAGGELSDVMARTGAAGRGLVIMEKAFENAGMAAERVPDALNRMQKALAGVNDEGEPTNQAFQKLNLSIEELRALDPVDAFRRTAEAIAAIEDPAARTAIAMELFGKSGGQLLVTLTDSRAFADAAIQVGGLADILTEIAPEADVVSDAVGGLDVKVRQLGAAAAKELMPQLLEMARVINETDFTTAGTAIGILAAKTSEWGGFLAEALENWQRLAGVSSVFDKLVGGSLTPADIAKAREEAERNFQSLKAGWNDDPNAKATSRPFEDRPSYVEPAAALTKEQEKAARDAERAAAAADKKAAAEARSADELARRRAAAVDEYNLESELIDARLAGDTAHIAALEREKSIRAEISRLVSAGFSPEEARRPAARMVDAQDAAASAESRREAQADEKRRIQEVLAGKVNEKRDELESLRYESTIGSISSMQRVGGGGGAAASGLDYARQSADLQRQTNEYLRQLIDVSRRPADDF